MLSGLFGDACIFAVENPNGDYVCVDDVISSDEFHDIARMIRDSKKMEIELTCRDGFTRSFYGHQIEAHAEYELLVILGVSFKDIAFNEKVNSTLFKNLVKNIGILFLHEYSSSKELDDMARELGERYEELNLVYDTEGRIQEKNKVHYSLMNILENCVSYMAVDIASLSLPDKNVLMSHSDTHNLQDIKDSLVEISQAIYDKIYDAKSSLVLNDVIDADLLCPYVGCKIMASPVYTNDNDLDGVLIIAKSSDGGDFTNSDRNLLEVMSKKVMQIIQSNYDGLTGVLNRQAYESRVDEVITSDRYINSEHIVLDIDLDDFQVINESYSHQIGDRLLKTVSDEIKGQVRDSDTVARLMGDEFGVLLVKCPPQIGVRIANKINDAIRNIRIKTGDRIVEISATIGMSIIDSSTNSMISVLADAEVARDAAKEMGKNRVMLFKAGDNELEDRKEKMKWVGRIRAALREERFVIYSQPIVSLGDGGAHHVEILLRMSGEEGQLYSPYLFIPAAESYNLMPDIDRLVITNTLSILSDYQKRLGALTLNVAINLSGQSISNERFLDFVISSLENSDISADRITFEVTESAAIANIDEAKRFIATIRKKGCAFSLDDFGTGLSSFSYLKTLNVDYLKIDGSFIKDIVNDPVADTMVSAINRVGHVMNLKTIAEYVENDDIISHLTKMGIDFGQGYGFAKPCPLIDYLEKLS